MLFNLTSNSLDLPCLHCFHHSFLILNFSRKFSTKPNQIKHDSLEFIGTMVIAIPKKSFLNRYYTIIILYLYYFNAL